MTARRLGRVEWDSAIATALQAQPPGVSASSLVSLSALFIPEFELALARVRLASSREPLQPVHQLRKALLLARFGDLKGASSVLERLNEKLPEIPLVDYLRALFALRGGAPDKARGICGTLETTHPNFVHGKFLRAEAQIVLAAKPGTAERYLTALPGGTEWEALWADLLAKLVLLHAKEGIAIAQKYLDKQISQVSPARGLVLRAIAWAGASEEELGLHLASEPSGSRGEALVLECLAEKLKSRTLNEAFRTLTALRRVHPERAALRRLWDAFVTRAAAELSASKQNEEALRFVEMSLRGQPQDSVHHQNRAAIFTMLREPEAYHEAWAALNTHQYRLALMGALDTPATAQIVRMHRLFAQEARGSLDSKDRLGRGIFRLVEDGDGDPRVVTNVEEIAADPDLLRQWMHHAKAELIFRHVAMGPRTLLNPTDRDDAVVRAEALVTLGDSLRVLVPDEGQALGNLLAMRWRELAARVPTLYESLRLAQKTPSAESESGEGAEPEEKGVAAPAGPAQAETNGLKEEHLQVCADLCLICLHWRPESGHIWVAEELIEFLQAETAFFEETMMRQVQKRTGYQVPYAIKVLSGRIERLRGPVKRSLTVQQKTQLFGEFLAELLSEMAWSAYNGHSGSNKESAAKALSYVDRARAYHPANSAIELTAAKLFAAGEFFDEAKQALERFRRLAEPDDQKAIEQADKLDDLLRERRKEGKTGEKRTRTLDSDHAHGSDLRIQELHKELDVSPAAWRLYEELVRELAVSGRFDDAIVWADRSVAQCLSRAEQLNARGLAIEARGMKLLASANPRTARLYAVGAHDPARKALESLATEQELEYPLLYLLGRCDLAGGLPDKARERFEQASLVCDRPLHRTVLRGLADNIDNAYVVVARAAIKDTLREGSMDDALEQAGDVFPRLQKPEVWLPDFARVYYNVALGRLGISGSSPPTTVKVNASWQGSLNEALAKPLDVERTLALAALCESVYPPSAKEAKLLAERATGLQRQILALDALKAAGALLSAKKFDSVLDYLSCRDPELAAEPRIQRIKALALLGLRQFDEADLVIEQIGSAGSADVRDFLVQYPALALRQRLSAARELLRQAKVADANVILRGAISTNAGEEYDLAYCRAFALTLDGYDHRRQGKSAEARRCFVSAISLIEPFLTNTASGETRSLAELYDRLEKEVESHAGR